MKLDRICRKGKLDEEMTKVVDLVDEHVHGTSKRKRSGRVYRDRESARGWKLFEVEEGKAWETLEGKTFCWAS